MGGYKYDHFVCQEIFWVLSCLVLLVGESYLVSIRKTLDPL